MALQSHLGCFERGAWQNVEVVVPVPYRKPRSVLCNYGWAEQGCSHTSPLAYVTGRQGQSLQAFQEAQILETLRKPFVNDLCSEATKERNCRVLLCACSSCGTRQVGNRLQFLIPLPQPAPCLHLFASVFPALCLCFMFYNISRHLFVHDWLCKSVTSVHEGNCLSSIHFLQAFFKIISSCIISCARLFYAFSTQKKSIV